jgi:hypothetical protein
VPHSLVVTDIYSKFRRRISALQPLQTTEFLVLIQSSRHLHWPSKVIAPFLPHFQWPSNVIAHSSLIFNGRRMSLLHSSLIFNGRRRSLLHSSLIFNGRRRSLLHYSLIFNGRRRSLLLPHFCFVLFVWFSWTCSRHNMHEIFTTGRQAKNVK